MNSTPQAVIDRNVFHKRMRRIKGRAAEHSCVDCSGQARDWSWIHDTDPMDMGNYVPRCRSCHKKYDHTPEITKKWRASCPINMGEIIAESNRRRAGR